MIVWHDTAMYRRGRDRGRAVMGDRGLAMLNADAPPTGITDLVDLPWAEELDAPAYLVERFSGAETLWGGSLEPQTFLEWRDQRAAAGPFGWAGPDAQARRRRALEALLGRALPAHLLPRG